MHSQFCHQDVGQGFVKQEYVGIADDGPTNGYALTLAAGKFARIAIQQSLQLSVVAASPTRRSRSAVGNIRTFSRKESHIVANRQMRIECIGLEHHRHAALRDACTSFTTRPPIDNSPPVIYSSPEMSRSSVDFPASGRASRNDPNFAVLNLQIDTADNVHRPEAFFNVR